MRILKAGSFLLCTLFNIHVEWLELGYSSSPNENAFHFCSKIRYLNDFTDKHVLQALHIFLQKSNPLSLQIFIGWKFEVCSCLVTLIIYMAFIFNSPFIHHFPKEIFNNKYKNTRKINFNYLKDTAASKVPPRGGGGGFEAAVSFKSSIGHFIIL